MECLTDVRVPFNPLQLLNMRMLSTQYCQQSFKEYFYAKYLYMPQTVL